MARRLREVRPAVMRVVWNETETEAERYDFEDKVDLALSLEREGKTFCEEPLDDQVARICLDLDLSPDAAEHWRDLPNPAGDKPPANAPRDPGEYWRGSG